MDKEVVRGGMPKRFENARIALVNSPLEVEKPDAKGEISIIPVRCRSSWTKKIICSTRFRQQATYSNWNSALRSYALRVKYSLYL